MAVVDPALVAAIADALTRGQYPGLGAAQNDSTEHDDNVDATHPLNVKYLIPGNTQRIIAARLSFSLGAYRTYTSAANNPSVTSGSSSASSSGSSSSSTSGASSIATTVSGGHTHETIVAGGGGTGNAVYQDSVTGDLFIIPAGGNPVSTNTESPAHTHGMDHNHNIDHTHGIPHTHSVTSNVTLTNGVIEDATATGVSVAFDGVDKTSALGGPFNADKVEMDVLPYIQQKADKTWHTIALTPSGNGRIYAKLRLSLFVNAGINA
jgi:hypothetical protein